MSSGMVVPSMSGMKRVVDQAAQAQQYFSAGYTTCDELLYGEATYRSVKDTSETYSVEGSDAEVRHDLVRLAWRTRCFSRRIKALRRAMKLFVWADKPASATVVNIVCKVAATCGTLDIEGSFGMMGDETST